MNSELFEKLGRVSWLCHAKWRGKMRGRGPMADPTQGQGRILAVLKLQDGISTKDLAFMLGIKVSSLNELLSKLEKCGYVAREPLESDRRVMLVKITERGREVDQNKVDVNDLFACLSEDDQKMFGELLDRLIESLEADLGEEAGIRMNHLERMMHAHSHGGHGHDHGHDPFGGAHRGFGGRMKWKTI